MLNNLNSNFLRPNWDKPMDQSDPFESALSSIASSPTASNPDTNAQNLVLRQLNNSCYATPLNSPPNLNLSADPAFADRAARFSCFANHHSIGSQPAVEENWESAATDSRENSAVSDQIATCRKRKSATKGKPKESTTPPSRDANTSENSESSAKRSKSPAAEAPKDYIHVRARRGEAKDPHSLAERVRREKIGERMKILQDLVPGCNKVTGKAVMLDEIINYVQSLQHQVEFLSMKLATVNPRMDFNMEAALMSKDIMFQSRVSLQHNMGSYAVPRGAETPTNLNAGRHQSLQLDSLGDAASQVSSFWEEDLHSIVQMGFRQQHFQGRSLPTTQMKVEL